MLINYNDDENNNTAESNDNEEDFMKTEANFAIWVNTFNDEEMINKEDHENDAEREKDNDIIMNEI